MYQFRTYKVGPTAQKGGWFWQITKDFGPIEVVVARSVNPAATEDLCIQAYKDMRNWQCGSQTGDTTPPPPTH